MEKNLISEQQVKKALGIESFRNLSKDKIIEFVSMIPHMDKELAISIINQFPAYTDMAKVTVEQLQVLCDKVIAENNTSINDVYSAYRKILDDLGEILKREDITPEERAGISSKMVEIVDKMAVKDTENKEFLLEIVNGVKNVVLCALALGVTILGVKGLKLNGFSIRK